jgi:antitoxin MazE
MKVKLSRWGNSLAVRIPSGIAAEASLRAGNALSIEYADGALRLTPLPDPPSIEDLIAQIDPDNIHEEEDFGGPVGREVW